MDSNQFSDLPDFLSDCIKTIKKSHPNQSSSQLAKKLDLATSTFSRFENKEIKRPSFNHALRIVREAYSEGKVQDFIKIHYPEMYNNLAQTYPGNVDLDFIPPEAELLFEDSTTYELMMMATTNAGITAEVIQTEFGKRGIQSLEKLIERNTLRNVNGRYILNTKVNAGQETVKKLLHNLVNSSYDLQTFGTQKNWLSVQYEYVDAKKVTPKLRDIYIRANKDIRELFNAPENSGQDVLWAGLVMDSLIKRMSDEQSETDGVIQ